MSKFLAIFFSLYTAVHALVYLRFRILIPDRKLGQPLFIFFLVLMIAAPVLGRLLEKGGADLPARYAAAIGFNWMGIVFLAFCGAVLMQVLDGLLWGLNHFSGMNVPLLTGKFPALVVGGLVLCLSIWGHVETRTIEVERLRLETEKLPSGIDRLKIVQISDVHLGLLTGSGRLKKILAKVKSETPDLLVCTGDLIDSMSGRLSQNMALFNEIRPRYGKYAVTGNHEYYTGLDRSAAFIQGAGFRLLRQDRVTISGLVNIAGVDDAAFNTPGSEAKILTAIDNKLFTLFLKHRPLVEKQSLGLFDLQLSGHTHGGQIFPFHYVVRLQYPLPTGHVTLPNNSHLYTNRGTGTWGPQMRILSAPEITVVELTGKDGP